MEQSVWKMTFKRARRLPRLFWERFPNGAEALEKHNDLSLREILYLWQCVRCADEARASQRAKAAGYIDPDQRRRERDSEFLRNVRQLAADIRKLVADSQRFPEHIGWALAHALLRDREKRGLPRFTEADLDGLDPNEGPVERLPDDFFARLLSLADSLEGQTIARSGPFSHRYYARGLLFAKPIDEHVARPSLSTSMLFSLGLFGRICTSPCPERLVAGLQMPKAGRPRWDVAVAFAEDVFGELMTEKDAADRIDKLIARHPGVAWGGFLDPPLEFLDTPHPDTWS